MKNFEGLSPVQPPVDAVKIFLSYFADIRLAYVVSPFGIYFEFSLIYAFLENFRATYSLASSVANKWTSRLIEPKSERRSRGIEMCYNILTHFGFLKHIPKECSTHSTLLELFICTNNCSLLLFQKTSGHVSDLLILQSTVKSICRRLLQIQSTLNVILQLMAVD